MDHPPKKVNGKRKKSNGREQDGSQRPHSPPSSQSSTASSEASVSSLGLEQLSMDPTQGLETPPGVEFVPDPTLPQTGTSLRIVCLRLFINKTSWKSSS